MATAARTRTITSRSGRAAEHGAVRSLTDGGHAATHRPAGMMFDAIGMTVALEKCYGL